MNIGTKRIALGLVVLSVMNQTNLFAMAKDELIENQFKALLGLIKQGKEKEVINRIPLLGLDREQAMQVFSMRDENGNSLLHWVAIRGMQPEIAEAIFEYVSNCQAKFLITQQRNKWGKTPMDIVIDQYERATRRDKKRYNKLAGFFYQYP